MVLLLLSIFLVFFITLSLHFIITLLIILNSVHFINPLIAILYFMFNGEINVYLIDEDFKQIIY